LYQNDDYGRDYVTGLRAALGDNADSMIVGEESYEVTDPTIDSQIVNLQASGADIFYNVSIPKFAAQAIKKIHDLGWEPVHLLNDVSTSVSAVLEPAGLDKSKGIVSAAYIKDPTNPAWRDDSELGEWNAWMDKYYPGGDKADGLNAYAYAVANLLVHVLRQAGDDLSRDNIMRQAAGVKDFRVPMTLPGIEANTTRDDYDPLEQAQIQRFNGAAWEIVGSVLLAE
jgi:ABC-type branched-subunit amino acid transport system substrate-binding protein